MSSQNIEVGCQSSSFFFFKSLDPVVGNTHSHTVVEAYASVGHGQGQSGHARHFFGYGYGVTVDLMDELVGQGEVCDGVGILRSVVIVAVAAESLAKAVVVIEHRGDAVEAETVEMEFREPVFAI